LPDSSVIGQLYDLPFDSLIEKNCVFDTPENGFYPLCKVDFLKGQQRAICFANRPITREFVYILGKTDSHDAEVSTVVHFHRLGNNEVPKVEIIPLK